MAITLEASYRWLNERGAHTTTGGKVALDGDPLRGYTSAQLTMRDYERRTDGSIVREIEKPADPSLPGLVVKVWDTGAKERDAIRAAGFRLRDDATFYEPESQEELDAAREYWRNR